MKEENIQTLSFQEHIKKRPGMYIGDTGSTGIISLVKGVILTANKSLASAQNFFHFSINKTNDFVLEIKSEKNVKPFIAILKDELNQYPELYFHALEALSTNFEINPVSETNVVLHWSLDEATLKSTVVDYINLCSVMLQVAYLNRGCQILISDKSQKYLNQTYYAFPEGIKYLYGRCKQEALGKPQFELSFDGKIDDYKFQIFLGYRTDWHPSPLIMSFANDVHTICGGSLVDGIREGLILGCRQFVKKKNLDSFKVKKKKFNNGLILVCSVRGNDFIYGGSFKESLIDENVKKATKKLIKDLALDFFENHREKADKFLW